MAVFDQHMGGFPRPRLLHGRYALIERAGRESVSPFYRGIDVCNGNRPVVIQELGPAAEGRPHEAALLTSLRHPNLPPIYDVFSDRGSAFLVMEAIEGKTLLQLLREHGGRPLPVPQVLDYARQLCDALVYLARCEPPIIVRDLQPSRVLVSANGRIYLLGPDLAGFSRRVMRQGDTPLPLPGPAGGEAGSAAQSNSHPALYGLGLLLRACLRGAESSLEAGRAGGPILYCYNYQVPVEFDRLIQRLVTCDERQPQIGLFEVQQMLMRIGLQAEEHTIAVAGPGHPGPQRHAAAAATRGGGEAESDTLPVNTRMPLPASGQSVSGTPARPAPPINTKGRVWRSRFVVLSALALLLLLGSSLCALVLISSSAHLVEFGWSMVLLTAAVTSASSTPPLGSSPASRLSRPSHWSRLSRPGGPCRATSANRLHTDCLARTGHHFRVSGRRSRFARVAGASLSLEKPPISLARFYCGRPMRPLSRPPQGRNVAGTGCGQRDASEAPPVGPLPGAALVGSGGCRAHGTGA